MSNDARHTTEIKMAQVDFKITNWERVEIPNDKIQEVIERIKNGTCTQASDLMDIGSYEGVIEDTGEQMSVAENDGQCTIDVFDENGEPIFDNVPS
jgi:hypothetical protein